MLKIDYSFQLYHIIVFFKLQKNDTAYHSCPLFASFLTAY